MAKASIVAVRTAALMQEQADQNNRIEQKLDRLLQLAGDTNKPAKDAAPKKDKPAKDAAPKKDKPAKDAAPEA